MSQAPGPYPYPQGHPPKSSGMPGWVIAIIVVLLAIVAMVGIMAVLAVSGTRRYIALSKQAEAKNSLGAIARAAAAAYEEEDVLGTGPVTHRLCKSASRPVPASISEVAAKKYMSSPADWRSDPADTGFTCLKFEMSMPQYYAYDYKASATGFKALASGDLDGDGHASHFEIEGRVGPGDVVTIAPSMVEVDADE